MTYHEPTQELPVQEAESIRGIPCGRDRLAKRTATLIVRYLRVRLGDENKPAGSGPDCITVDYSDYIILDHLSLSWGIDGNGDFRGLKHATLQWLIFSEALHDSLHGKGPHGMCSSFRDTQGPATMHHNIYASSRQRHPTINGGSDVGGWDPYPPIHRLYNWDTDCDRMPDAWERTVGFDPDDAADGNEDRNSDGYTNLEEWLHKFAAEVEGKGK